MNKDYENTNSPRRAPRAPRTLDDSISCPMEMICGEAIISYRAYGRIRISDCGMVWTPRTGWRHGADVGKDTRGYPMVGVYREMYRIHQLVAYLWYGPAYGRDIDHINGDKTDFRPENLRYVSKSENSRNARCHRAGQPFGVTNQYDRWKAQLIITGKTIYLGYYSTAATAADVAELADTLYKQTGDITEFQRKRIISLYKGQ